MRWIWTASGLAALILVLGGRRVRSDRHLSQIEADLFRAGGEVQTFSESALDGLPEPARRYLSHAIAPGTALAPACRIEMDGTMTPSPGAAPTALTATETLAPRSGFVWTARASMNGLPVRVQDHYFNRRAGLGVHVAGLIPIPTGGKQTDIVRSARGRLIAEAVWCPTALVHPEVRWETVDSTHVRYTLSVDGGSVATTLHLDDRGALREVTLQRWGAPDGEAERLHPYGFRVDAESTFAGVTIPTQLTGGWDYGTETYDPTRAATFTVRHVEFATAGP